MKFTITDFFSKCDQIHRKLRKFLMQYFIFVQCKQQIPSENKLTDCYTVIFFYKQLGSGLSPEICLYFQGFQG